MSHNQYIILSYFKMALVCFDIDLDDDVEVYEENLIDFNMVV